MNYSLYYRGRDLISQVLTVVLGLACWFIVVGLTFVTACDIMYITSPVIRGGIDKLADGNWNDKMGVRVVSKDALNALNESYTTGKSALICYLVKRLKTYVVAAVMLWILVTGPSIVVGVMTGVVADVLSGLGII